MPIFIFYFSLSVKRFEDTEIEKADKKITIAFLKYFFNTFAQKRT